jgi:hypothetical protein
MRWQIPHSVRNDMRLCSGLGYWRAGGIGRSEPEHILFVVVGSWVLAVQGYRKE